MRRILLLVALLLLCAQALAQTSLPPDRYSLNLKGVLNDNAGIPRPNGVYSVQFRLYDVSSGPNPPMFIETQNVTVFTTPALVAGQPDRRGKYAVSLGFQNNNPLRASLFVNRTLWLEIVVNGNSSPRQQILQIPADSTAGKSMSQVIWVTNALYHIDLAKARETAALAYYIRKIYDAIPNADPRFVLNSLIKAQNTFNQRYRSPASGEYRFAMLPIDAITNMYGVLVQQPGNPVTLPIIGESLIFAAGAIDLGGVDSGYQQFSYELGRMSSTASFNEYQNTQLEALYLLGRQNPNAALVIDTFFGFGWNANIGDSLFSILQKNPGLKTSPNFAPLMSQIEADGTMLSTLDTTLANIADFYDRMTAATRTYATALGAITKLQRNDYVGSSSSPSTGAAVQTIFNNAQVAAPSLTAMTASTYTNAIVLQSDAAYARYELTLASLELASATANGVAAAAGLVAACTPEAAPPLAVITPDPAEVVQAGAEVAASAIDIAAAALNVAAAAGEFDPSPDGVIKDGIVQIGNQLANLQTHIDQRLSIIDSHIIDLYNQMNANFAALNAALNQGFSAISNALDKLSTDVIKVQYTLDRLTQSFSTFATQSQRASLLVPHLTIINSWGETPPPPRPGTDFFNQQFNACVTYATSTSLTNAENGNLGADGFSSLYGNEDIVDQLDANREKNLNYLLGFIYNRFYLRPTQADLIYTVPIFNSLFSPSQSPRLANPTSWEMSALGMMRAATIYPDLGLPFVQASNSTFAAAYNVGKNIQDAATLMTLQQRIVNGIPYWEKSPIVPNMLLHQKLMADNLYAEIVRAETVGYPPNYPPPANTQAARTAFVLNQLNLNGSPLNRAAKALDGSHRLLELMCEFGLSRSKKSNDFLGSLLHSSGASTFRDPQGNLAADPNAQRLPDGGLVKALYNNWVSTIPAAPAAPTVTAINGASTLAPGTYYVTVTYTVTPTAGAASESLQSAETAVTIGAGQQIRVTSPTAAGGLKYRVYIGSASGGAYYLQNGTGTNLGTNFTLTTPLLTYASTPPAEQYNQYVVGDPKTLFQTAENTRWTRLSQQINGVLVPTTNGTPARYINGILDNIVADAIRNGAFVGEQIASVDAILSRLGFFLIPTVNGTIKGMPLPNLPAYMQPRTLTNTAITMQFNGVKSQFSAPVLLDNTGRYTVYVPRDEYVVMAQADSFLQSKVQVPGNILGYVNTNIGTTLNANALLHIGDVRGDNLINNNDLIALRNALNSTVSSTTWAFAPDINDDGTVDTTDRALIQSLLGTTSSSQNWNPRYDLNSDGVINNTDLNQFDTMLTSPPLRTPQPAWNALADINLDSRVDIADESIVQAALGSVPGSANWYPRADINSSGRVDLKDLSLLQSALGTRSTTLTYDSRFDLNYDGVVDFYDQILLQGALYSTPGSFRWNVKADLNTDGQINDTDRTLLFVALGSIPSSANWNPAADINNDGIVDYLDQEIMHGKVGTTPGSINWNSRFDFNGDAAVGQTDINLLQAALGARAASANWNPYADLNGDNVVDNLDLQMLRTNFGRQGQR
jgi:hypothetical protein